MALKVWQINPLKYIYIFYFQYIVNINRTGLLSFDMSRCWVSSSSTIHHAATNILTLPMFQANEIRKIPHSLPFWCLMTSFGCRHCASNAVLFITAQVRITPPWPIILKWLENEKKSGKISSACVVNGLDAVSLLNDNNFNNCASMFKVRFY